MSTRHVDRIVTGIREAEAHLTRGVRRQQRRWRFRVRRGRIWFDEETQLLHRRFKQSVPAFLRDASLLNLLTTPVIYSLAVPMLLLDLWITVYQWACFPLYGIARVPRRSYFVIDRHKLAYLNAIEKANCMYCSYANGLFAYVREVTARTELYWCPIKHARRVRAPHSHYQQFLDYGDAEGYRRQLPALRRTLRQPASGLPQARGHGREILRGVRNDSSVSRVDRPPALVRRGVRRGRGLARVLPRGGCDV